MINQLTASSYLQRLNSHFESELKNILRKLPISNTFIELPLVTGNYTMNIFHLYLIIYGKLHYCCRSKKYFEIKFQRVPYSAQFHVFGLARLLHKPKIQREKVNTNEKIAEN